MATRKVLENVAGGLAREPAYLLIFGLCLLFVPTGTGLGVWGLVDNKGGATAAGAALLVLSLVAAVATIIIVERKGRATPLPKPSPELAENHHFSSIVAQIVDGLNNTAAFDNKPFQRAVERDCNKFVASVGDWSKGQYTAGAEYNELLRDLYHDARTSIFATSTPSYLVAWKEPLGERLLDAHRASRAQTTRVFVYNNRSEVNSNALEVMRRQAARASVDVQLYFDQEYPEFTFAPDIGKDFTIIDDGDAIGVTATFGEHLSARWYFNDATKIPRFRQYRQDLLSRSIPLRDFV